jgi:hypothetical protein
LDEVFDAIEITIPAGREHVPNIRGGGNDALVKFHGASLPHFSKLDHSLDLFIPMPSASVSTATAVKPGVFSNWRRANFQSFTFVSQ